MYGNTTVAGRVGNESTTVPVRGDTIAGGVVQAFKELDATEESSTPIGTDANPKKVKPRRRGTADYDSGNFAVNDGAPSQVTAATIFPEGGVLINDTNEVREFRWTDASDVLQGVKTVEPKDSIDWPLPKSGSFEGLKVGALGGGCRAHIAGGQ